MLAEKANIIYQLQKDILLLQGYKVANSSAVDVGLGPIKEAFPSGSFPLGAVHEFLSGGPEGAAATSGFIAGLLATLMRSGGTSLWISSARTLFPPALKSFGIQPDRFIFIDLQKEKDVSWAMEEALKCGALTAVVGEMKEISFTASRRLQLAVEESQVTGFILRNTHRKVNTTACVSRWKITPLPSESVDDLPGIGFPQWKVELLRIRNGKCGVWEIKWEGGKFHDTTHTVETEGGTRLAVKELPSRDAKAEGDKRLAVKELPSRDASFAAIAEGDTQLAVKELPSRDAMAVKTG